MGLILAHNNITCLPAEISNLCGQFNPMFVNLETNPIGVTFDEYCTDPQAYTCGGTQTYDCGDLSITYGGGQITIAGQLGVDYPHMEYINITGGAYEVTVICDGGCGSTQTVNGLPPGSYLVKVFSPDWSFACFTPYDSPLVLTGGGDPCSPDTAPPVISGCPANMSLTTAGSSATATWTAPTATDNCTPPSPTLTGSHSPGASFPLGTTTVTYTATDGAGNTATCSFTVTVSQPGSGGIDLELGLAQPNGSPAQWTNYEVTATLQNTGGQTATGVQIRFAKPAGVVYTGGNEYTASQGSFNPNGNETWRVGSIPAGASATLTVNYFLLQPTAPVAYAQVSAANETDSDSTPDNGTPPSVNEDDEASTSGGSAPLPDLVLANLNILNSPIAAGEILNYDFDISNQGAGAASGNFNVKAWVSTDNVLSADDIQDGTVPTGNYGPGLTQTGIQGASTVPAGLSAGAYFLLLKVDADDDISEGNEGNNLIFAPFTVSGGGSGGGDIDLSLGMTVSNANPPVYTSTEVTLTITNVGPQTATGVVVDFPRPAGTVYTGGNEWTATQGSFNPFGNEQWTVGSLPAGGTASITVGYFLLSGNALTPYAQVLAANETDVDSSPGNGICCTPNEDDEATLTLNAFAAGGGGNVSLKFDDSRQRMAFDKIYPNPAQHFVTLEVYSAEEQDAVFDFYDQQGRAVLRIDVVLAAGRNKIEVQVGDWKSGAYNVIGRGEGMPAYGRFLKVWEE